jgi:hypothetical protein
MAVAFLEWRTRRPLDIMASDFHWGHWVELDVLHSNGFEWSFYSGTRHDLL